MLAGDLFPLIIIILFLCISLLSVSLESRTRSRVLINFLSGMAAQSDRQSSVKAGHRPSNKKIIQKSNLNYGQKRLGYNPVNTRNKVRGKMMLWG